MKIQYRITLIFVSLTVAIILAVNGIEYYFTNQNTFEDFYKRLEIRAIIAAKLRFAKEAKNAQNAYEEVRVQHLERLPNEKEYFLPVDSLGSYTHRAGLNLPQQFYNEVLSRGSSRMRERNVFYLGYLSSDGASDNIVVVSATNEFIDTYLKNLRRVIVISILSATFISTLVGIGFSRLILNPIRAVTQKMQEITVTQLHLRLKTEKGSDEITTLSDTFNNMLDRLETAFETQKNFISNASHELNTPLTTIIGESELALSKVRTSDDYKASLSVILSEAERLKKITSSLLHLAQTGFDGKTQSFDMLRTDEVIYTAKETVESIIPESKICINLNLMPEDQNKLLISGNLQLLEIAFVNIVMNACKYSMNKPVHVTLAATNQKVIVIIEDQGIGIPSKEIAYIYEPFFRASNTGKFYGYGIGLPLARNIIRIHHGELEVTSQEDVGTKIRITLPTV